MICQTGLSIDYKLIWNEKQMIFLQLQRGKKNFSWYVKQEYQSLFYEKHKFFIKLLATKLMFCCELSFKIINPL